MEALLIAAAVLGLGLFVFLWRRFPKKRKHLVAGSVLLTGGAVFAVWWVLFRIDDPTFARDRDEAIDIQRSLDDALGKDF